MTEAKKIYCCLELRKWVFALIKPIHMIQYILGKDLYIPRFACKFTIADKR